MLLQLDKVKTSSWRSQFPGEDKASRTSEEQFLQVLTYYRHMKWRGYLLKHWQWHLSVLSSALHVHLDQPQGLSCSFSWPKGRTWPCSKMRVRVKAALSIYLSIADRPSIFGTSFVRIAQQVRSERHHLLCARAYRWEHDAVLPHGAAAQTAGHR